MPLTADYTYDRDADCFVVTDGAGNELCRTASPHKSTDKMLITFVACGINEGRLIFPSTGDTQPRNVRPD